MSTSMTFQSNPENANGGSMLNYRIPQPTREHVGATPTHY